MVRTVMVMLGGLVVTLLVAGCGSMRRINYPLHHTYFPMIHKNYGITRDYPKSFTIYPFKNTSWYPEAAARARESTFQAFSLIGPCYSMAETDRAASYPYTDVNAIEVARQQGTDAVVIGDVEAQDHIWLVFLAYSYIETSLRVYDTRTGKLLWVGSPRAATSEFGISMFFTPIKVLLAHGLWSRKTMDLYHRANMDTVHAMRPDVLAVK